MRILSGRLRTLLLVSLLGSSFPTAGQSSEIAVAIRTGFPGGNVLVEKVEGATIHLKPDLRGGPPWFYWHFEAQADHPGTATFHFADPPRIGARGPGVSEDAGRSWRWLGADRVKFATRAGGDKATKSDDHFSYTFTRPGQAVRFAVAIPYLQRDLEEF